MNLQIIIVLGSYMTIALGSYTITALRECLAVMIKPIKEETIQRIRWFFLILTILWLFTAMALPGIAFILTQNPLSFTVLDALAPPTYILIHIVRACKKGATKPIFCDVTLVQAQHERCN